MKRIWIVTFLLIACTEKKSETVLSPQQFLEQYQSTPQAILLDVRTEQEVAGGKIKGAQNIVYDNGFASKLDALKHKPIFIYCGSGIRSAKAAKILKDKGYENIYELAGGIKAWGAAGLNLN